MTILNDDAAPIEVQVSFTATDDATVRQAEPDTNFGTSAVLEVDLTPHMRGYLKFDVTGIAGPVISSTVKLVNRDPTTAGGAIYHVSSTSWDESTITWNNRPLTSTGVVLDTLGDVAVGVTYSLDVSAVVTGNGAYSFVLVPLVTNGADYDSKEGLNAPVLEVTWAAASSTVQAETHLNAAIDGTTAVVEVAIDRFKNPADNSTSTLEFESFVAGLTYDTSTIEIVDVIGVAPFGTTTFTSTDGTLTVTGTLGGATVSTTPAVVAKIAVRLIGSALSSTDLTLASLDVTVAGTAQQVSQDQAATNSFTRGNAQTNSATVNIFDALFIAQCLAGLREYGTATNRVSSQQRRQRETRWGSRR